MGHSTITADHGAGRGWSPVLATAAVAGVTQVFWLTYAPVATDAAEFYGVSTGAIAALNLVFPVLYLVLAIPSGRWLDRSPRTLLLLGAVLTAIGGVVRVLGDAYAVALAGQLVVAAAQPVLLNGLVVVARANLPAHQRPAGIAAGSVGFFLGILLGYTMPVALADGTDLEALLLAQALLGVVASAWMVWAVRHMPQADHLADDVGTVALREVVREPGVRVLAVLAIGGFGVFGALLGGAQPLLEPWGVATDTADLLVDGMVLAGLLVAAFLPALAARRGRQRRVLGVAAGAAGVAAAVVAVAGAGAHDAAGLFYGGGAGAVRVVEGAPSVALLAVGFAVIGAALVPALPILLELAERRLPELAGTVAAVIWLAGNLGVVVLTGVTSALYAEPSAAFSVLAVTGGLTSVYALRRLTPELTTPR